MRPCVSGHLGAQQWPGICSIAGLRDQTKISTSVPQYLSTFSPLHWHWQTQWRVFSPMEEAQARRRGRRVRDPRLRLGHGQILGRGGAWMVRRQSSRAARSWSALPPWALVLHQPTVSRIWGAARPRGPPAQERERGDCEYVDPGAQRVGGGGGAEVREKYDGNSPLPINCIKDKV